MENIAGSFVECEEDSVGLYFKAVFSNSELPLIKHARQVYKEGHGKAMSISGIFLYENPENPKQLTLAKITEISCVAVPADPNSLAVAMQKAAENLNDSAVDEQTRASQLHEVKTAIDRLLEMYRVKEIEKELKALTKL